MPSAPFLVRWGEVMTGRLPPGIGCLCLASLALLVVGKFHFYSRSAEDWRLKRCVVNCIVFAH